MDSTKLNLEWDEHKGKLKQKIASLTDNEVMFTDDQKNEMFENIEMRLSKSKEEIRKIIEPL